MPNNTKKEGCDHRCSWCKEYDNTYCSVCRDNVEGTCKNCSKDKNKEEGIPMTMDSSADSEVTYVPSPQSPLSEEEKERNDEELLREYPPLSRSVYEPSSNEDWRESIEGKVESILGSVEVGIVELIRQQRLEAQRSLAEEIEKIVSTTEEDKLPEIYRFLSSRGLLPKITE